MASITELFTREDCNEAQRLNLWREKKLDDKGKPVTDDDGNQVYIEHWIDCLGTDSDAFQKAKRDAQQSLVVGELVVDNYEAFLLASIVVDWSFDEECNHENAMELMVNTPSLATAIDKTASKRANFTKRLQANSTATPKTGSGSRNRKTQKTSSK